MISNKEIRASLGNSTSTSKSLIFGCLAICIRAKVQDFCQRGFGCYFCERLSQSAHVLAYTHFLIQLSPPLYINLVSLIGRAIQHEI
jgi:hypothetical protein